MARRNMTREEIADLIGEPLTLVLRNRATGRHIGKASIGGAECIAGRHLVRLTAEDQQDIATGDIVATIRGTVGEMPEFGIGLALPIPLDAEAINVDLWAINVDLGWPTVEDV